MILTIAAQKGGVSKTTTAAAMAQAFSFIGKKALLIDLDAQGSASLIYGASAEGSGGSYALIKGTQPAEDLIQETRAGAIIPASRNLANLTANKNEINNLKKALTPIKEKYDFIILDTAPGLGISLMQALTAADSVIIPLLCDPQALQGLHQVNETINDFKRLYNPNLSISSVVLTQYQARATLTKQYEDLIAEQCRAMGLKLANTRIRRAIAIQEAQALRESIYTYAPKSNPAADYMALCEELGFLQPVKRKKATKKG